LVKRIIVGWDDMGEPCAHDEWKVPLTRYGVHVYASMDIPTFSFFSRAELQKVHRQFRHASADKLYKLLKLARPDEISHATLTTLEDLIKKCGPCQRISRAPGRASASLSDPKELSSTPTFLWT